MILNEQLVSLLTTECLIQTKGRGAMGQPKVVAELVKCGKTPMEIADQLGVAISSVEDYLHRAVGKGHLRRSDVYFSVPPDRRMSDRTLSNWYKHALGDMYEDIWHFEVGLHSQVRVILANKYGEDDWWRQGLPEKVRVKCQERRERDPDPRPPFCYTDLLDLDEILNYRWELLNCLFPDYKQNRKRLSSEINKLNRIRNNVMHPVRGIVPANEDFEFVRMLKNALRSDD